MATHGRIGTPSRRTPDPDRYPGRPCLLLARGLRHHGRRSGRTRSLESPCGEPCDCRGHRAGDRAIDDVPSPDRGHRRDRRSGVCLRRRCGLGVRACLHMSVELSGPNRLLRVFVNPSRAPGCELIASIGHELQHALEALSNPHIRTTAELSSFFHRIRPETPAGLKRRRPSKPEWPWRRRRAAARRVAERPAGGFAHTRSDAIRQRR